MYDNDACLLKQPNDDNQKFIKLVGDASTDWIYNLEGCYLHYNHKKCQWIQSGKAVGETRSLGIHNKEHANNAKLEKQEHIDKQFYHSYPDRTSKHIVEKGRKGFFQDLDEYCGVGFSRSGVQEVNNLTSVEDGILTWTKKIIDYSTDKESGTIIVDKQLHLVGYLWELGYDLMIPPHCNVSTSSGFETPLGEYPK